VAWAAFPATAQPFDQGVAMSLIAVLVILAIICAAIFIFRAIR
jgi:hypothetical protein